MNKKLKLKPRDPQKPKNHEKTVALDPWGARESKNKPRFDPVKVGRCDDLHTITKVGAFFFLRFPENEDRGQKPWSPAFSVSKISVNPPIFINNFQV